MSCSARNTAGLVLAHDAHGRASFAWGSDNFLAGTPHGVQIEASTKNPSPSRAQVEWGVTFGIEAVYVGYRGRRVPGD